MPEFEESRDQLQRARAERREAEESVAAAREAIQRIRARERALDRVQDPRNGRHREERERLRRQREDAERDLARREADRDRRALADREAVGRFSRFTDPRESVARLSDQIPFLLLPVRLETRFKTVVAEGRPRKQLWVRVYPDDCSIDTFEPTLTETEVESARLYWTLLWQSGGIEDQERGAWRGLVASHGSGRAAWILENYRPLNLAEKPSKALASDVILVVPTEAALNAAERTATAAYWRSIWLADGEKSKEDAARAALESAVGAARAAEIIERYEPSNLKEEPQPPRTRTEVTVTTAFVVFPGSEDVATQQLSWSRAPRVAVLPDRFALIAYADGAPPVVALGNPIPTPLIAGPDPSAPPADQLQQKNGDLAVPEGMKWMVDFERAVEVGMGFRIDLNEAQAARGFDRLLAIGLRFSADEKTAKTELETLFEHHRNGRSGLSLVPQGTPTNNTESAGSGFTRSDDPDASFDDLFKSDALFEESGDWLGKKDGQWLSECLGIDSGALKKVRHSGGSDQAEGRAMNTALWPATLGYWMETMMSPVFGRDAVENTRLFFNRYVSGRGMVPAIRIGSQPYGVLPATAFSRMRWMSPRTDFGALTLRPDPFLQYLGRLYGILRVVDEDWKKLSADVSFAGKPGDAHRSLLDIVGLHPGSVEFSHRYAESLEHLFNRLNLQGLGGVFSSFAPAGFAESAVDLLKRLGYAGAKKPDVLGKFFFGKHHELQGPVIDDRPLSGTAPIRGYTPAGRNYLEWLIDAAGSSFDALRLEEGFTDGKRPRALLYLLLRHALQLGFYDVSLRLHEAAGLFSAADSRRALREPPFVHVAAQAAASESRYQLLYKTEPAITGTAASTVADHVVGALTSVFSARYLREQLRALEYLKRAPTARLERALAEHLDCCTYRLDAWLLGLVHYQLASMRGLRDGEDQTPRQGIYLGAYAWLENVAPENKVFTPVRLEPALEGIFDRAGDPPLLRDSTNHGYVHAPSLNHAVTSAVLRNGYLSDASPANRQTLAVNLTSERVRTALSMLEGIRGGQSLGALLGYQFERGLHDRHGLAEVDKFIFKIRKAFPLGADKLATTRTGPEVSIESIEARNVMDGLMLVDHIKKTGAKEYPFDMPLPRGSPAEEGAINAEVDRLLDTHDAVADLAIAEGVYQAVQGNFDRVAATLETYSKGNFPPEPQVVRTPANGTGLTHRVALHLEAGADPIASPVAGTAMTPRAQIEPALNRWLEKVLPPLSEIGCTASFRDATTNTMASAEVTLRDLAVQPIDLLYLFREDSQQAMSELDDRVVQRIVDTRSPRPDEGIAILYMDKVNADFSIFEVMPLVASLRRLAGKSRALKASDLALQTEASQAQDELGFADKNRIVLARTAMQTVRGQLFAFQGTLEGPLSDLANRRPEILADVDSYVQTLALRLSQAARFALPKSGWGLAYDWQQRQFRSVMAKVEDLLDRWEGRLTEFAALITAYEALPAAATQKEKFDTLLKAEQLISTTATAPLPPSPDVFKAALLTRRAAFSARRDLFEGILTTKRTAVVPLLADVKALLPVSDVDPIDFSVTAEEDQAVQFASDALGLVKSLIAEIDRRLAESQARLDEHQAAAQPAARVRALQEAAKVLLGDDAVFVPEFQLSAALGDEVEKAIAASQSNVPFEYLTNTAKIDFPLDDWLYGVARVRDKMRAWEQVVMHAGGFGRGEPELTALQLPFKTGDRWLGLKIPPGYVIDGDRLLYTAHFPGVFQKTARQCGLLLDEWTEVIPGTVADTGIAFHYDRPNSEPPQAMLLVTPAEFQGGWRWADLVDALNETLDLAKRRAVEPSQIDDTAYARFLPATIMAVTVSQLTISANLAVNNDVYARMTTS